MKNDYIFIISRNYDHSKKEALKNQKASLGI